MRLSDKIMQAVQLPDRVHEGTVKHVTLKNGKMQGWFRVGAVKHRVQNINGQAWRTV